GRVHGVSRSGGRFGRGRFDLSMGRLVAGGHVREFGDLREQLVDLLRRRLLVVEFLRLGFFVGSLWSGLGRFTLDGGFRVVGLLGRRLPVGLLVLRFR
ncbi:MAG: hypothetical protein PVI31_14875, partial [Gemmatimonadota bacterium]